MKKDGLQVGMAAPPTGNDTEAASSLRIQLLSLRRAVTALDQAPTFLKVGKAQSCLEEAMTLLTVMTARIESLEKQLDEVTHGTR